MQTFGTSGLAGAARIIVFLVALISLASAQGGAGNAEPFAVDAATVDKLMQGQIEGGGLVGASVAVMHRGKIIFAKGYGTRSLAKGGGDVTPSTVFNIGSVSKQFTAAAVLLLAEEGKLSAGDKVAKYFPRLTRAGDITLLDLMHHTAGYPDYYPLDFLDRRMLKPVTADEILNAHATLPLDFEPGTQHSYSNTGYVVLARVVEKVSGKPFGRFLAERFFRPLKMRDTFFEPLERDARFADGHTSFALGEPEVAPAEEHGWGSGAGGIFSTASDLARWDLALMDGKVLRPAALKLMTTRLRLKDGSEKDYGAGVEVYDIAGDTVVTHGGATAGFTARNTMVPSTRSAIVILSNTDFSLPGAALNGRFLRALLTPKPPVGKTDAPKAAAAPAKRAVPRVEGVPAADAAGLLFGQMQAGRPDRSMFGEEFAHFLDARRSRIAAANLKPFGDPSQVKVLSQSERGGMEFSEIQFVFPTATLNASMYRSPDGKIQSFSIRK